MPISPIAPIAQAALEGADLVDQTAGNTEELSDIRLNKKISKDAKDITALEGVVSWASVGFSAFSLILFGKKLPMYKNSAAGQWINKKLLGTNKPKALQSFHDITKNIANLALATVNIGLLSLNGSSIPLFSETITSDYTKAVGKNLKEGWKALEENKYLGGVFKGLAYFNKKKNTFINSKATRNVLGLCLGLLVAGTGPVGLTLVTLAVATDIAKGAYDVNKTNVLRDELEHLRSLKASIAIMGPEKAKSLNLGGTINPELAKRSQLHSALKQSSIPAVIGQGSLIIGAAFNPAAAAVMLGEAAGAGIAILGNKFTEESARSIMEEEIIKLREETGAKYGEDKSRRYALAKIAFNAAILAGAKPDELKQNPLFSNDKLEEPKGLWRVTGSLKSCIYNIGNYIHPFKEPTSCVRFVVNDIEQKKVAQSVNNPPNYTLLQSAPSLSPPQTPNRSTPSIGRTFP